MQGGIFPHQPRKERVTRYMTLGQGDSGSIDPYHEGTARAASYQEVPSLVHRAPGSADLMGPCTSTSTRR